VGDEAVLAVRAGDAPISWTSAGADDPHLQGAAFYRTLGVF